MGQHLNRLRVPSMLGFFTEALRTQLTRLPSRDLTLTRARLSGWWTFLVYSMRCQPRLMGP